MKEYILLIFITLALIHHAIGQVMHAGARQIDCPCDQEENEDCDCSHLCREHEYFDRCPDNEERGDCITTICDNSKQLRALLGGDDDTPAGEHCRTQTKICKSGFDTFPVCNCKPGYRRRSNDPNSPCITNEECRRLGQKHRCNKHPHEHHESCPQTIDIKCSDIVLSSIHCLASKPILPWIPKPTANEFAEGPSGFGTNLFTNLGPSLGGENGFKKSIKGKKPGKKMPAKLAKLMLQPPCAGLECTYCVKVGNLKTPDVGCRCDKGYVRNRQYKCVLPKVCLEEAEMGNLLNIFD